MNDKEILAELKISYYNLDDIIENSDETQLKSVVELQQVQKILEAKYEEIYNKIKNENDISLYYEENLIIAPQIYNDYIKNNETITANDKWWEDTIFLKEF